MHDKVWVPRAELEHKVATELDGDWSDEFYRLPLPMAEERG